MKDQNNKRLTIIIITYNQENLIGRALDSILIQKEWGVKDIIICDDCSTDNNWKVINKYAQEYPDIIRAYRNEKNLGIYGNLQHGLTYIQETDLITFCSGDDAFCDGYFKVIQDYLKDKDLDYQNEPFAIYSDFKFVYPNNKEKIFYNKNIKLKTNPISLKLRNLIYNRSVFCSLNLIKSYHKVPVDRGVSVAEGLFDLQMTLHSKKNFYVPVVGSIYYAGIGVSTKMWTPQHWENMIERNKEYLMIPELSKSDIAYINHTTYLLSFYKNPTFKKYLKTWYYYIKSGKLGFNVLECLCTNKIMITYALKKIFLHVKNKEQNSTTE